MGGTLSSHKNTILAENTVNTRFLSNIVCVKLLKVAVLRLQSLCIVAVVAVMGRGHGWGELAEAGFSYKNCTCAHLNREEWEKIILVVTRLLKRLFPGSFGRHIFVSCKK